MKNTKFVIIIVVCVCVILGGYYYLTNRNNAKEEENITLTEIQELTTKNLDKNFPATPREVVKLYNRIITCFYNDEYTDDELYDLGDQARKLFDDELLENNPRDEYFKNLKEDISEYHDKSKTIASFIKEGNAYSRTYQMYVLRKDADGNWKILVFYQVNGDSSDDE